MTGIDVTEEGSSRLISIAAGDIRYHEAGEGPPVLLVHGSGPGTTGWGTFRHNIGPLSEHHRVLAIDMPGWGRSYLTEYDPRHQVDALVAFIEALGLDRTAVLGSSLGGVTGLQLMTHRPDLVERLITVGAAAPGVDSFSSRDGASGASKAFLEAFMQPNAETIRRFSTAMVYDERFITDQVVDERLASIAGAPEKLSAFLTGMGSTAAQPPRFPNIMQNLQRSTIPVLAIHGRDDRLVSFESALRIAALVSDARAYIIGRAGHWVQSEKASEVNPAVASFLAQE